MTVSDQLREMLVNEDSENAFLFTDEEKKELLFHLLKVLAVGGAMTQFEDKAAPYIETAKGIYKDFLTVYRNAGSGKVEIANCIFRLRGVQAGFQLFPTKSDHNMYAEGYFVLHVSGSFVDKMRCSFVVSVCCD